MAFKKRDGKRSPEWKMEGEKPKRTHAFVATPAYDGRVHTDYTISLAESCQIATLAGIQVTAVILSNGAFIDIARNHLVRLFLESECTHLFFIDSDLKWEPRAFVGLLQSKMPVCAGAYPKRQDPEEYPVRYKPAKEGGGLWVENGWVMCDRVATGFLCIERSVLEKMAEKAVKIKSANEPTIPRIFYTYLNDQSAVVGEDFAFCGDYCEQFDTVIPVWPDFDFVHDKRWPGNFHQFLGKQVEKEEKETAETSSAA